jgi:TolB-like protein
MRLTFSLSAAYFLAVLVEAPNALRNWSLRYHFENYALDTDRRELRRGTDIVPVTPQVFDLLHYLILNRERVVSKDDLVNAIWNGRSISEAALTTRLNAVRRAIGDTGDEQRLIKTLPRKGLRFVGSVREGHQPSEVVSDTGAGPVRASVGTTSTAPSAPPHLSIVVLPFVNLGGDPEQDYFVDGVTESLTTDLSRIAGAFVIARNTAFAFKGRPVDVRTLGRELNIRYVLEGSVQRDSSRLRVNVQLIDAEIGNHIWSERFDRRVTDLFEMQDEIVSRLANTLDAQLMAAAARRAERSARPDAMELYFQGRACQNKGLTTEYLAQAIELFDKALALEPDHVDALVSRASANIAIGASFLTDDRTTHLATAEKSLTRALNMAPEHARAHMFLGAVQTLTNRPAQGIARCEHALALDRNLANAHATIGLAKFLTARSEETESHVNEALRLSPRDPFVFRWLFFCANAKLQLRADDDAVIWLHRSIEANRNYPLAHFNLAAALALLGQVDLARDAARSGLMLDPGFTIRRLRDNAPSDNPTFLSERERIYRGMRLAGVPEG